MSKSYDVTVFDAAPKALKARMTEYDITGRYLTAEPPQYLPDDYDCATLSIASASESVGRSLGIKNDWYCLCLDADEGSETDPETMRLQAVGACVACDGVPFA